MGQKMDVEAKSGTFSKLSLRRDGQVSCPCHGPISEMLDWLEKHNQMECD